MLKISAIIMASGCSSRMGTNKLFLDYQGESFLERTLKLTKEVAFFERILVISPENLQGLTLPKDLKVIQNTEAKKGQSSSVRLGTKVASGQGYLYFPIDQPLLNQELLESLFSAYSKETIVFPVDQLDAPCSPIFFGEKFRSELLKVTGSAGGRCVRKNHPEAWRKIQVKTPEYLIDIDTPEEYQRLIDQNAGKGNKNETASLFKSCSHVKPQI
ncbi:NTP transferase domain-containing protein [Candidatus Enterococcus ikei]|uniref:NTP transferase domain-containing protein n=1 Tax=Candidatus Enterococcus ikei TaxID=2815326 RepID=A0ABS3GWB1_9ENTE|nr:NTP transferase domain-containing protein [Enterococcus sp. DIV0869a]MBO0439558.1 NTP transferase domain-containing protein [Enterococcus sp. DIV0869a]